MAQPHTHTHTRTHKRTHTGELRSGLGRTAPVAVPEKLPATAKGITGPRALAQTHVWSPTVWLPGSASQNWLLQSVCMDLLIPTIIFTNVFVNTSECR